MKDKNIIVLKRDIEAVDYIINTLRESRYNVITKDTPDEVTNGIEQGDIFLAILPFSAEYEVHNPDCKIPFFIITNYEKEDELQYKKYFLKSPFSFQSFLNKIKKIEEECSSTLSDIYIDTLHIDTNNKEVTRGEKNIKLTKKEYILLEYLARNKDKAVTRTDLLEKVWNMQIDPFSNTVEAHVFSLRKKIDGGETVKLIHTVPKYGYRISIDK